MYNRTLDKAEAMAEQFGANAAPTDALATSAADVYVNCTPIGMHPNIDVSPMPMHGPFKSGVVVFDTIYNPVQTKLLRDAAAAGCVTIPGTEMFVRQGAAQFELWTGQQAPLDVFRHMLQERLQKPT